MDEILTTRTVVTWTMDFFGLPAHAVVGIATSGARRTALCGQRVRVPDTVRPGRIGEREGVCAACANEIDRVNEAAPLY